MTMKNFLKVSAVTPTVKVGDVSFNRKEIVSNVKKANKKNVEVLVFPELSLTGYTNGDNFFNEDLISDCYKGIEFILKETKNLNTIFTFGSPIIHNSLLYNSAVVCHKGKILGVVPKTYLPNYKEYYEKRHFASANNLNASGEVISCFSDEVNIKDEIFITNDFLLKIPKTNIVIGVEICEDLFAPIPRSALLSLKGANIILNLSSSVETIGKDDYRRNLIKAVSGSSILGYIYANSGLYESTTDAVFSGHNIIAENGVILTESKLFNEEMIISDIDITALNYDRKVISSFADCSKNFKDEKFFSQIDQKLDFLDNKKKKNNSKSIKKLQVELKANQQSNLQSVKEDVPKIITLKNYKKIDTILDRKINPTPFIPKGKALYDRCEEIINMQIRGLETRLSSIKCEKVVIGLSGGLDSCLAFLICLLTFKKLKINLKNIFAVSMPCFGTTKRTKNNAKKLAEIFNTTYKEIDIKKTVLNHFNDIKKSEEIKDLTYENAQARVRTLTLFDLAGLNKGIVVGTGDLSELALGWTTFGGDHLSNYGVNSGIPKTLIKHIINYFLEIKSNDFPKSSKIKEVLLDIINTPISPELLPPKNDNISQKTEEIVGDYILHDFFLYHLLRYERSKEDILKLALFSFSKNKDKTLNYNSEKIKKTFKIFCDRFYKNQFKRSCMPDGLKVGSVSLSPRSDFRLPSDM